MKRIVIDARELRTGSGRYVERMVHYLQQVDTSSSHRYTILLKPQDMDGWQPSNPNFSKLAAPYKEFTFGEQLGFWRQIQSLKADLVHFPFVHQPVLYRGRVVTTMQDLTTIRFRNPSKNPIVFAIKQQIYKAVNRYAARKSLAIITPSEFVKQDVVQYTGISPKKVTVTYESSDFIPDDPVAVEGLEGKQFLVYVGRPLPHKNLWRLIEAFQLLQERFPDLYLVLVGKKDPLYVDLENRLDIGSTRAIRGIKSKTQASGAGDISAENQHTVQIASPKVESKIILTGFVSEAQLKWLYQNCQAYTFPSLSEGFGLPALEAMRHGAPLISSNATCSPEIYGDAALYFDPLDVSDIARKITMMLTDDRLRQDCIAKGYKQAAKYSWRRMAEQTLSVYNEQLAQ